MVGRAREVVFHSENVENIIPKPALPPPSKPTRFRSRFAKMVRDEWEDGKQQHHVSMGEASTNLPHPEMFLRKHTGLGGSGIRAKSAKTHREIAKGSKCEATRRPPVPRVTEHVAKHIRSDKNIVHWNAFNQMRAAPPPKQEDRVVDAPNGSVQMVARAGLAPNFVKKKTFGKTPSYIQRFKAEAAEEARKWEEEQEAEMRAREAMKLSEEERFSILQGLKENWTLINETYQKLSLLTDTLHKRQRKARVETRLQQLERFIQILEQHPVIYITDYPHQLL